MATDPFAALLAPQGFATGGGVLAPSPLRVNTPAAAPAAPAQAAPAGGVLPLDTSGAPPAPAPVDPYGPGGQYYAQSQQYTTGLNAINTTAGNSFQSLYDNLMASADQIGASAKSSQLGINQGRENNELNRINGIQDILSYVRNGLQSGGAQLAHMNAGDSSASGALARAYNLLGAQQSRGVNQQAAMGGRTFDTQQQQLGIANQSSTSQLSRYRDSQVQNIATDIAQRLAVLDQQAAGVSLPGRVNIDQQKQQLIDEGNAKIGAVDSYLQNLLGGITPEDQATVQANANQLRTAGTASSNPFASNLPTTGLTPLQGPALDQLPILVRPKAKTV